MKISSRIFIVGAGGVGSWLTPSLCLLADSVQITVIDGDRLESKNLNRQLFTEADIGLNKAEALSARYNCNYEPYFYHSGSIEHDRHDWIICCVDNHRGRRSVLQACDAYQCKAIFAANEVHSAEAYYYHPAWRGRELDPRIYYPEIEIDDTGDPLAMATGCTGEAQEQNRQLVSANFMAAALAQHLFVLWAMEAPGLSADVIPMLPYKLNSNLSKLEFTKIRDTQRKSNEN